MLYQDLPFSTFSILNFISIIPTVIFFVLFLRDYIKTRQQMFAFLVGTFGLYLIQHFFAIRQAMATSQADAELFFIIAHLFKMLTLYCLLIVLEMFERNNPFSGRITLLTALLAATIGAVISDPSVNTVFSSGIYFVRFAGGSPVRILQGIYGLIAGIWLFIVLSRSYKRARAPKQKRLIVLILVGFLFYAMLGSFLPAVVQQLAEGPIPDQTVLFAISGIEFSSNIGMFIIGYAFYRASKQPWLLQRQKVHLILVYSKEGLDLYSKIFSTEISPDDVTLLTGGFTAVTSMFQEATKTGDKIQSIQFEGRTLRLLNRDLFIAALLVDYTTQASELALRKFAEEFEQKFHEQLRTFAGNVSVFEKASTIAEQYFS